MLTAYKSGAEQEAEIVTRYETGAEVEAEAVYAYKSGAEEEVWSSGYKVTTDSGGFADTNYGFSITEDEICMAFKLGSSETVDKNREITVEIHGNFVNPVINCTETLICETTYMSDNAKCSFLFYNGDTLVSEKFTVGWENTDTVLGTSVNNQTVTGTFDKIVIRTRIYVALANFRNRKVKARIKNLTIDGKKIKDNLTVGSQSLLS